MERLTQQSEWRKLKKPVIFSIYLGFGVGCNCVLKSGKGKKEVIVRPRDMFTLCNARNLRWPCFSEEGKCNVRFCTAEETHFCSPSDLPPRLSAAYPQVCQGPSRLSASFLPFLPLGCPVPGHPLPSTLYPLRPPIRRAGGASAQGRP